MVNRSSGFALIGASAVFTLAALAVAGWSLSQAQSQATEIAALRAALERLAEERAASPTTASPTTASPPPSPDLGGGTGQASMAEIAGRALPAVVNISISEARAPMGPFGGRPGRGGSSLGSGVIVSADGLVVTNHHVIANGGNVLVTLSDGREYPAELVGADPQTDMALLRLRGDDLALTPIAYGDSSQLRQGDVVLAIGNPFGVGQTVTMGIVSAIGRANMGISEYEDFIQTDAAINPGNSGGALISMRGELVGINTAILSRTGGSHGIGFAIPSNMVRPIIESLLRNGKVVRGWLGVTIQDVTPELATAMSLPVSRGVIVTGTEEGSPAANAGIQAGDLIEQLDSERLQSTAQLRNLVATRGAGVTVQLVVMRAGERRTIPVELAERPQVPFAEQVPEAMPDDPGADPRAAPGWPPWLSPGAPAQPPPPRTAPRAVEVGGLAVVDLDDRVRAMVPIPRDVQHGAVVVGAQRGSPGAVAGLEPGDVIVAVNRAPIAGAAQLAAEYARAGGNVVLLVRRGPARLYVVMR